MHPRRWGSDPSTSVGMTDLFPLSPNVVGSNGAVDIWHKKGLQRLEAQHERSSASRRNPRPLGCGRGQAARLLCAFRKSRDARVRVLCPAFVGTWRSSRPVSSCHESRLCYSVIPSGAEGSTRSDFAWALGHVAKETRPLRDESFAPDIVALLPSAVVGPPDP